MMITNASDAVAQSIIVDAEYGNESSITANWTAPILGCTSWKVQNHHLFQVANGVILLGLMAPHWKRGDLFLHGTFVIGFMLLAVWAWMILCAPDYFSWNFAFMVINIIQTLILLYDLKPIKFDESLEKLYETVFQPMDVSRRLFKKLVDDNFCIISTLYEGDAYAVQGITKTDRLGMLVQGSVKVYSHQNFLHFIHEMDFLDSPEFESSVTGEEKFQVSIYAASYCKYISWPRQGLEYLLVKEPFLATVLNTIMGRDITNKLYALNNRVKAPEIKSKGNEKQDVGRTCDLRRTLAQLSTKSYITPRVTPIPNISTIMLEEEPEEVEGPYSQAEEEVELISQHNDKTKKDSPAKTSLQSCHSGLQFTAPTTY